MSEPVIYPAFMAFVADDTSAELLRGYAVAQGWPSATVQHGGPTLFSQLLESAAPPALAVVDIDGSPDPVQALASLIDICGTATRLIAIGSANDVRLYRQLLQLGIADYLIKPLTHQALQQARQAPMAASFSATAPATTPSSCQQLVVLGTQGGVGATTIAVNLGWQLAAAGRNVGLLDLDLHYGGAALALDCEASRGLRDLLANPTRIDSLMLASAMIMAAPRLAVLAAEEDLSHPLTLDPVALRTIINQLTELQDWLIIDLPRQLALAHSALLKEAATIILVTEPTLQGVRDTLRLKKWVQEISPTSRLLIICSRGGRERPGLLDDATFAKGIEGKPALILSEDKAARTASAMGKPIVVSAPKSALAQGLQQLYQLLVPASTPAKKTSSGFWSRSSKAAAPTTNGS